MSWAASPDLDELEEVEMRVPAVVRALAPMSDLIAANLADVAHFLKYLLHGLSARKPFKALPSFA